MRLTSKSTNKHHNDETKETGNVGDDYSESSSIDNYDSDIRMRPPPSVDDLNSGSRDNSRDNSRRSAHQQHAPQPACTRQLGLSGGGLRVPKTLSFYKKGAGARGKQGPQQQMAKKMLTCDQLSDLFRRLDRNGNGTLEKFEFMDIVKKLRLVSECVSESAVRSPSVIHTLLQTFCHPGSQFARQLPRQLDRLALSDAE